MIIQTNRICTSARVAKSSVAVLSLLIAMVSIVSGAPIIVTDDHAFHPQNAISSNKENGAKKTDTQLTKVMENNITNMDEQLEFSGQVLGKAVPPSEEQPTKRDIINDVINKHIARISRQNKKKKALSQTEFKELEAERVKLRLKRSQNRDDNN